MNDQEALRQSLLELHYELLDEAEAAKLRAAIASDPEVASEWARTLRLVGQLAEAARIENAYIPAPQVARLLDASPSSNGQAESGWDPASSPENMLESDATPSRDRVKPTSGRRWWLRSGLLAATAAAIGCLMIGSWHLQQLPPAPASGLRLQARAVPGDRATAENEFRFMTSRVDASGFSGGGFPVTPASLSFSVLARGSVLFSGTAETGTDGTGRVVLPPDLAIPEGARLRVTASSREGGASGPAIEVPLEPTRCLTLLKVDRPVYRPGETVFFRSLTLQRHNLRAGFEVPIRFELLDPSGSVVPGAFLEGVTDRGVGNGAFNLPSTAPGGAYTIVAKSLDGFFPEEHCEFQVRAYRVPRFKKELEFRRRSYGPGEMVVADFSAERAEGGELEGATVLVTAKVDDKVVYQTSDVTSVAGTCQIKFSLPEVIRRGVGTLSVTIDDGATRETKTKTLPIQLGNVVIDFHPEGGYLVGGLENRVYFVARDTLGEPIHIAGEILDRSGKRVAEVETVRDGMGRFAFVPRTGEQYTLKVTSPVDVTSHPTLPAVVKDLPVLDTGEGVFGENDPLSLTVRCNSARSVLVRAVCRGRLVGQQQVDCRAGERTVTLPVSDDAGGVIRLTLFDADSLRPLVERLVYRRQSRRLKIEVVESDKQLERSPGEPIRLNLQVRDERGEPTPAVLGVSVVDDAALALDETERPTLRTHFLLTSEVQSPEDLEHANFYLSDEPEAAESLDLLLGTQGWRRFVSGSASQSQVDFREQLIRLLELDGDNLAATPPPRVDNSPSQMRQWDRYWAAVSETWERILIQAQLLMVAVLLIWLAAIVVRMRRAAHSGMAAGMLLLAASLLIYGCGAESTVSTSVRVGDAAPAAETESAEEETPQPLLMADEAMDEDGMGDRASIATEPVDSFVLDAPPANLRGAPNAATSSSGQSAEAGEETGEFDDPAELLALGIASGRGQALGGSKLTSREITPQKLKRLLAARGLDAAALADQLLQELRFPVRQYAHQHRGSTGELRQDFAETLYWQPILITDSEGRGSIRFDLSDSVTGFRVQVDGHTSEGRIGSGDAVVVSRLPFQIEPKLPLEVTTGDRIDLPIAVVNTTEEDLGVELSVRTDDALSLTGDQTRMLSLGRDQRVREHVSLEVREGSAEMDSVIEVRGVAGQSHRDTVRRSLHVSPAGYPARHAIAGVLNRRATVTLPIPTEMVDGSLAVTVRAYPSPLADVMSGVESILREPHGCFEQTSATNYPNTMALLYMNENEVANPEVSRRARGMLDRGYQKLTSFECDNLGYEWFGSDPGHEALSAFGLMQFNDMARIMNVSEAMVARTRTWLMGRRDGQGGFQRNPRHLHVWSVQQPIVNAYVLWAITEADVASGNDRRAAGELAAELDMMTRQAMNSDDPYLIGLSAAALLNVKRTRDGEALLEKLAELHAEDGSLTGMTTVTSSGGISLKMETTAIGVLAWIKSPRFLPQARAATRWITANRQGDAGFGSTQATVLALKALVAMSAHSRAQSSGGDLKVLLRGEEIGRAELPREPASGSTVEIRGLGTHLQDAGPEVEIELVAAGAEGLSFTIDVAYHAITPDSDENCPVQISTELRADQAADGIVTAGETLTVKARLENRSDSGQPMTVAIVGLPGGVEPRIEKLEELQEQGRFDYYELRGREVILYWRTVAPRAVHEVSFDVTAAIPGQYTGPASRAYLYYTAEQKHWVKPLEIEIQR